MSKEYQHPYLNEDGSKMSMPEKKAVLRAWSKVAKVAKNLDPTIDTTNQALLEMYVDKTNADTWHSYKDWIKEGKRVKAGETAYLLWSKPIKKTMEVDGEELEEDGSFWAVAHVFNNLQVEEVK